MMTLQRAKGNNPQMSSPPHLHNSELAHALISACNQFQPLFLFHSHQEKCQIHRFLASLRLLFVFTIKQVPSRLHPLLV